MIGCCCPACGDLSLQRQRIKRLLMQLEREHPGVKASLLKALGNVMPRHLLDRRLTEAPVRPADDDSARPLAPIIPLLVNTQPHLRAAGPTSDAGDTLAARE